MKGYTQTVIVGGFNNLNQLGEKPNNKDKYGFNCDGRISSTLQKTFIFDFTDFCIKNGSCRQLAAVSAVCCLYGTLYMFSKSSGNERQLVLCDKDINGGYPVFLGIGNHHPVSLFGGCYHSAAIGSEGEVIFINRNSVKNSTNSPIIILIGEKWKKRHFYFG